MPDPLPTPTPPKPPTPAGNATGPVSAAPKAGSPLSKPPTPPITPPSSPSKPLVTNPPTGAPKPPTPVSPSGTPVPQVTPQPVAATKPSTPLAGAPPTPPNPAVKPPMPPLPGQPVAAPVGAPKPPGVPGLPPRPPLPGQPGQAPNLPPAPPVPGRPVANAGSLPPAPPPPSSGGAPKPAAPAAPAASNVKPATPQRSSILRFLPFILGGLAILGVIVFLAMRLLGGGSTPSTSTDSTTGGTTNRPRNQTTLTYWGLWEPTEVMQQVFADFEAANPQYKVNYVKQSHLDYRQRLQTAISQGNGPDLFRFHASWTPMLREDLTNVPNNVYSPTNFQNTFYPVAYQQLQAGGQLKGVPLMYDGLALYYNEDMLKTANATVPKTWAELRILANSLTVRNGNQIQRGGLAIGNASNVEHFADILGLLMLQNGADPTNPTSDEAEQALIFYTDFIKKYNVWSDTLPNSTVAFARGDAAMMLAPSWRAHEVIAQNPNLKFGIAPVPQLGDRSIAWASYWAEGVNSKSSQKDGAWKLIQYLSSQEVMRKMYAEQAEVRRFGELYSRKDLANELSGEPLVVPFLTDAPNARSTYMNSFTHDSGINDQTIKYYEDAINAVMSGTNPATALSTVSQGVSQVLRQYGVTTQRTTTTQTSSL